MLPRETVAVDRDGAGVAALALLLLPSRVAVIQEAAPTTAIRARTPTTRHGRRRLRPSSTSPPSGRAACCRWAASVSRLISYPPGWCRRPTLGWILALA